MVYPNGLKTIGGRDAVLLVKCFPRICESLGLLSRPESTQCGGPCLYNPSTYVRGRGKEIRSSSLPLHSWRLRPSCHDTLCSIYISPYFLSIAEIKTLTKSNLGSFVRLHICITVHVWDRRPPLTEAEASSQAGAWRQQLEQRPWGARQDCWCVLLAIFSLFSSTPQNHLARDGAGGALDITQENISQAWVTGPANGGSFSAEALSFQVSPACGLEGKKNLTGAHQMPALKEHNGFGWSQYRVKDTSGNGNFQEAAAHAALWLWRETGAETQANQR